MRRSNDLNAVICQPWREALSALADDEAPGIDPRLLAVHLERCPACVEFSRSVNIGRGVRAVAESPTSTDFAQRMAALNALADRRSVHRVARWGLAVVAVQVMVVSAVALAGHGADAVHASRHLGAFTAAYSVGLLVVVARPARARTMLPVAAVLVGALAITATIDLIEGRVPLVDEVGHLPELFSVVLLWVITRSPTRPASVEPVRPAVLRLVDRDRRTG